MFEMVVILDQGLILRSWRFVVEWGDQVHEMKRLLEVIQV
jgi:hypothetical protein